MKPSDLPPPKYAMDGDGKYFDATKMKTDNEIIAEFMGGTFNQDEDNPNRWGFGVQPTPYYLRNAFHSTLKYNTDWNWLMPVVEKIDSMMPSIQIPEDLEKLKNGCHGSEPYMDVVSQPLNTPITEVYQKVVGFIRWYNTTPPPQTEAPAQQTSQPDEPSK